MSRRHPQHGWDAVRSQIRDRMARCEAPRDEDLLTPDERHIFRIDDAEPYYGPTRGAREAVNLVLELQPGAGQIEWEAALGNDGRVDPLVEALGNASLDTEARSAIALLLLDHLDRMAASGTELLARIRWHLRADTRVQARMRYWWMHMDGSDAVMEALS
ncbi:MAG TPA: hypothetical protein VNS11_08030 [Sphingomicrobium sp.]|nr:hypothetical protein [Sphingomicrobium sp.]